MTCDGPWEYKQYGPCYIRSETPTPPTGASAVDCVPVSPPKYVQTTCSTPNTCRHSDFGVDYTSSVSNTGVPTTGTCETWQNCVEMCGKYACAGSVTASTVVCTDVTYCDHQAPCLAVANAAAAFRTSTSQSAVVASYSGSGNSSSPAGTCSYTLNVTTYRMGTGAAQCGTTTFACDDTSRPYYACRLTTNPLEADQSVCQSDTNKPPTPVATLLYSNPGNTYAQIRAADKRAAKVTDALPRCTTAEEMPMGTANQARAKFDRLESFRRNAAANLADAAASPEIALLSDGFESSAWSSQPIAGTGNWSIVASGALPAASPHGGGKLADFNSYYSGSGSQARLFTVTSIAVPAAYAKITLRYWMYHDPGYPYSNDRVQVQVSTDGASWTNAGPATSRYLTATGWTQITVDLSAYSGQPGLRLAFLGISEYGNDVYIDDVSLSAQGTLDSKIIRNERLLFELHGDWLNGPRTANPLESYLDQVVRLAIARPADRFDCGRWLPALAAPNTLPALAAPSDLYQGCYIDQPTRALPTQLMTSGATVEACLAAAQVEGLKYAGAQYGGECWAGNALGYTKVADSECNMACSSNSSETCGGTWRNSIYATRQEAAAAVLDTKLQLCDRFSQYTTTAETYAAWCINVAAGVKALPDAYAAKAQYQAEYGTVLLGLFGSFLGSLPVDPQGGLAPMAQRVPILRSRLAAIQRWYDAAEAGIYPAGDAMARYADASRLLKLLWRGNTQPARNQLSQTLDPVEYQTQAFAADRHMLLAAFPDPATADLPPLTSAPLLLVVADALRPFATRLTEVDRYHDLVCTFRGNCASAFGDELSQLHRLMGTLHDPVKFTAAAAGANMVRGSGGDDWRTVFVRMAANHLALQSAVRSAFVPGKPTYDKSDVEKVWTNSPSFLLEFSSFVRDATKKLDNYDKSGLFLAESNNHLGVGLSKQKQGEIGTTIGGFKSNLDTLINGYSGERNLLVQNLLGVNGNARQQESVVDRINIQAVAIEHQSEDLAGLRLNAEADAAKLGDFGKAFQDTLSTGWFSDPANANYKVQVAPPVADTTVMPWMTQFTGTRQSTIDRYQVPNWRVSAAPGEVLNIQVTGQWSPTCALVTAGNINGHPIGLAADAVTGPQGFEVQFANGTYTAKSHSTTADKGYYDETTGSAKACMGAKVSSGTGALGSAIGQCVEIYASAEACVGMDWAERDSHTTSDATNNGAETRSTASFAVGLRLANTPFPEFPAGSLLLVKTTRGGTKLAKPDLLDVRVLLASNSIPVDVASDYYLVVNDLLEACAPGAGSLTVQVQKLQASGTAAVNLANAMADVAGTLHAETVSKLRQGRVLPSEIQALRDGAWNQLAQRCACDPNVYPTSMTGFFTSWVSAELARMEREVEIRQLERQMETAMLELKATNDELQRLQADSRLLELLPGWTLQMLDGDRLRSGTDDLMRGLTDWVYPMVRLRYPETVALLEQDPYTKQLMDRMQGVDWTSPVIDMARAASDFSSQVLAKLNTATTASQVTGSLYPVVIAFPNPYYTPGIPPPALPYKKADDTRSRQVWDRIGQRAALGGGMVDLTLKPEDFYDGLGGASRLVCTKATPIISSLSLYVVRPKATDNAALNNYGWSIPVLASPRMTFPLSDGPVEVEFTNPAWLTGQMRVLFGASDTVVSYFHGGPSTTPVLAGLSPVNTFEFSIASFIGSIPFDPFQNKDAQALLVVADVDPRDVAMPGLSWVTTCK